MQATNITLGADPEAFLFSPKKGTFVSGEGLIGGTKDRPREIPTGALLEDNVMAEFNTLPVQYDDGADAFVKSITSVTSELEKHVARLGLELRFQSQATIPEEYLRSEQAAESGCDPDFNIYDMDQNQYPSLSETSVRYAGGHVHIGHDLLVNNPDFAANMIYALDCSLGAGLIAIEGINNRSHVYGRFGNFRPKPYGIEYRSASNIWAGNEELMKFVHFCVGTSFDVARVGTELRDRVRRRLQVGVNEGSTNVILNYMHPAAYQYLTEKKLI